MTEFRNPAVEAFVQAAGEESLVGQVLVRRAGSGWLLCHVADKERTDGNGLRVVTLDELRALAQATEGAVFRPLKFAPNLRSGWVIRVSGEEELGRALDVLYPGALADWHAEQRGVGNPTHYREFTARQTGMYRVTTHLSDIQAAAVIRACCDGAFCLRSRRWTVEGLAGDESPSLSASGPMTGGKSIIPCLEPCAVLLEFARKAARMEQADRLKLALGEAEWETVRAALEAALAGGDSVEREADFGAPGNPRRVKLLLGKVEAALASVPPPAERGH